MIITNYKKFFESQKQSDMWNIIPDSVKELHQLFQSHGKKLFVVGGAVRDFLTGDKPKDFDLCTDALPDEVLSILGRKYRTNLQGKAFGVVVVYTDDEPSGMEIATFRSDLYDGKLGKTRNPEVKFTTIEQDVLRRDIRVNGLFYDLDKKEIVDLVGGIEDINNGIIGMIGEPDLRIKEDPLRILRAIRMACRLMAKIEKETSESIIKNGNLLNTISSERIWDEIKKSYAQSKDFSEYLRCLLDFDLMQYIFPGSKINTEIVDSNDFVCYFANLFYLEAWSNDLERRLIDKYKVPIDITRKIVFLVRLEELDETNVVDYYRSKVKCHITDAEIKEWMRIKNIDSHIIDTFLKYKPSVSSEELMTQGFKPGKALGDEIKRLEIENFKKML
jgi:tRNA nucleotidyltransferase/poly(A) polymerase